VMIHAHTSEGALIESAPHERWLMSAIGLLPAADSNGRALRLGHCCLDGTAR